MAWMRQFSTVFGTSELAVATVLSAYMGGLALGAALAGKFIRRVRRPVLTYGILEAAIAGSALMVPVFLGLASWAYAAVLGGQPEPPDASGLGQSIFYFVVAFIVLAMPTACMGATLPLLTRYVVTAEDQIGTRVGALYAINTAGAVLGTIVAAFVLLPAIGLYGTVWFGVAVNLVVFGLAVLIARHVGTPAKSSDERADSELSVAWRSSNLILPIMLISGTTSFVYEVLWTRLLSHILGGSVAAFATMLASFLSGIAIGSALASRIAVTSERSVKAFVLVQAGIAVTSMAIYHWLHLAIPAEEGLSGNVGIAMAILMPATLFIGATFPLAVRIYAKSADAAATSSAQVYSWNTVGAIFGAAFAGFYLIPALRYEGAIKVVVLTNIFLGLATAVSIKRVRPALATGMAVVLVGLFIAWQPQMPEQILRTSPIDDRAQGEILYYAVGRSSTVLMTRDDGTIGLRNNGLPEAGTEFRGSPPSRNIQRALATLPAMIRPQAESMLIVGLGGGNTVNGVPPGVGEIDVIELEPRVIDANRLAGGIRVTDPLADPRLSIYINDARSALSLTSKHYDAIISQPSHPWTAGASHLYTQEYMQLVADRLTDDGVFLQWMAGQFVNESLLRSLCATMLNVFEHVRVYQLFPEVLFFVGSQQPMDTELELAASGKPVTDAPVFYYQTGFVSPEDLLTGLILDTEGIREFADGAAPLTDNFNRMATESAAASESDDRLNLVELSELVQPYVPLLRPWSIALSEVLQSKSRWQSLLLTGIGLRDQGDREEAKRILKQALAAAPEGEPANQVGYALIEPWVTQLMQGNAPDDMVEIANSLTGPAAAVLSGRVAVTRRDWAAVAALDALLAQSRPTDRWFVEATRLMVEWRNNVANIERRSDLADQAWQIIDLAIAVRPVPDLYAARVTSAYFADRPDEVLETARRLAYVIEGELDLIEELDRTPDAAVLQFRRRQIEVIEQAVRDVAERHELSAESVDEVIVRLEEQRTRTVSMPR
jgi:spermidine synthase